MRDDTGGKGGLKGFLALGTSSHGEGKYRELDLIGGREKRDPVRNPLQKRMSAFRAPALQRRRNKTKQLGKRRAC